MARSIMIQGTMSNAGKSLLCAALCRIFRQDGYRVAPFKSQNMALNSFVTDEGLEMGRAQVVQAEAAGVAPSVRMNPILLKPNSDTGSQVIVNGVAVGNMSAGEYFAVRNTLIPDIMTAYNSLAAEFDIIVIEGAGSPAELNLKAGDIVNMGVARLTKSPVLLVGDIDRGGVFAQLCGTVALLEKEERGLVKALLVNKFRGDLTLFQAGRRILEDITKLPVAGVVPYLSVDIDDEDSLSERFNKNSRSGVNTPGTLDIAVIRLAHISNFTDFTALDATPGLNVRYISRAAEFGSPELLIIPGTKNTIYDLRLIRQNGLEALTQKFAAGGGKIIGLCGGYQMLGRAVTDKTEGGETIEGMGLLPVITEFEPEKTLTKRSGVIIDGGVSVNGYEIHMGQTALAEDARPFIRFEDGGLDGCVSGNVCGTYLHGLFDSEDCRADLLKRFGVRAKAFELYDYKEAQYNLLADGVRSSLDMKLIYEILERGV